MAGMSIDPKKVVIADDSMTGDLAYRLACEGKTLQWRGDFQNAKQLLNAIARRYDRNKPKVGTSPQETFHHYRLFQSQRARILKSLVVEIGANFQINLPRAPNVHDACSEALGSDLQPTLISLNELLGFIGAHEWRKKGVFVPALEANIHPHFGVFAPLRNEYLDLIKKTLLPKNTLAFDIGTGTGVISILLAKMGVNKIIATDQDPRAISCARENISRIGLDKQIEVCQVDIFPEGRAPLVVCNPPWLPARPTKPIENAIYDPESRMLLAFLNGLKNHLEPGGEAWLIISDLAEHLGLRTRKFLLDAIANADLKILDRSDIKATHPKASDKSDPLFEARAAETTSLWRLSIKG